MVTEREYQERSPRIGIQGTPVAGAPVQRGGTHQNFTCRFPEKMLADITRLAGARGASKNSVIMWALGAIDLAKLADRAEEHGGGGTFRVDDTTPPAQESIEESMQWVESMILQVLREHQENILEWYQNRT